MQDSADSPRGRRRAETTRRLVRISRHLTAEHGSAGFTLEELCAEADVSRRTFFNYFASKDDAVLGVPLERVDAAAVAEFLAGGERRVGEDGLSVDLLSDLAALADKRWRAMDVAGESISDLVRAVDKEPRLLARMLELAFEGERFDARLIEQRENLLPGDLRAQVAAQIVGALVRSAAIEFLGAEGDELFTAVFRRRLDAAQAIFASQTASVGGA